MKICLILFCFILLTPSAYAHAESLPAQLADSSIATDWIVKDICVDASNQPVIFDSYYTCPAGTTRRKIQPGDPLPFHNFDQAGTQQTDSFPLLDVQGNPLYINSRNNAPYDQFHIHNGSGYDFYNIDSKWFSAPGTRDEGGYDSLFFGENCTYGDGWIFFPTNGFLSGGNVRAKIAGSYWEQNGMSYPGTCPKNYANPYTFWELKKNVQFGGVKGNSAKTMDAMVAYHGFVPNKSTGHMEIFWYTQPYGLAMWQAWVPIQSGNPKPTTNCIVPDTVQFQGVTFVVTDCRDWTNVKLATTSEVPQWPVPPANLLKHSHFDDGGGYLPDSDSSIELWHRGGNSTEGKIINWSLVNSTSKRDTKFGSGVRYMAANCGGTCTGPSVQQIYQELPISQFTNNATYLFGVEARSQAESGMLQVTLQEIDGNNHVLWQDWVQGTVLHENNAKTEERDDSAYLSTAFVHKVTTIPISPGATKIRFSITPLTPQTVDILDSWLNRFPATNGTLKSIQ